MSFNPDKWSRFLTEEMLVEGRLQDTMKKYPGIPEFAIKQLSASDPSGKNAYLMWMAKELYHAGAGTYTVPGNAAEYIMDIVPAVTAFHDAKQRISQLNKKLKKDGRSDQWPNDISQIKSLSQLEDVLDGLGEAGSQKKKKEKEAALGGASILKDDEDFFIIRPETREASCFFGKKTKWCISAERSQNYFDSYTRQGKAFFFILNKNLNDDSEFRKLALVYEKNGEFESFFDTADDESQDAYELQRILFYNLIAPAIRKSGVKLTDEHVDGVYDGRVDGIAGTLLDGSSLEGFIGSDGEEEPNEENLELYKNIVDYLQNQGDLAYDMSDIPEWGATTLYDFDAAASEFMELSQMTLNTIEAEASDNTLENPPGSFDDAELRQLVADAELEHVGVYYDEYDGGEWQWEGNVSIDLTDAPFDQLRYEVENQAGEKEITDDFEEAFDNYDSREMVRDLVRSAFDSAGMYIDEVEDDGDSGFQMRMTPDYDEGPTEGLEGFSRFLERMKRYDNHYGEAVEKVYQDLVDEEIAIDPKNSLEDEEKGSRGNLKEVLQNLKYMGYNIQSGKLDIYGKVVYNIPNMIRNFKEMQKFFPALPPGVVQAFNKDDDRKGIEQRQEGYVMQLQQDLERSFTSRPIRGDLLRAIEDKLAAPIGKMRDKRTQIEIPGLEDKPELGTNKGSGAEEYNKTMKQIGVDFFRPNFMFRAGLQLMDGISDGQKDAGELVIGDREIVGPHGNGMIGFDKIPLKDLRSLRKQDPEAYYAYINGLKWLDENYQEIQEFIGEWVSSQIVPLAKSRATDPAFADLTDADFGKSARDSRPKSGLAESKKRRRIRIKIGK